MVIRTVYVCDLSDGRLRWLNSSVLNLCYPVVLDCLHLGQETSGTPVCCCARGNSWGCSRDANLGGSATDVHTVFCEHIRSHFGYVLWTKTCFLRVVVGAFDGSVGEP